MRRIAVFTEGQTELIFVRWLLLRLIDSSRLSLECMELLAHKESRVPYSYSCPSPQMHFRIVDVHGTEGVLSSIREREKRLVDAGYDKIIGLEDMYSDRYIKLSPNRISDRVTNEIMGAHATIVKDMVNRDKVALYFAVMEVEACSWACTTSLKGLTPVSLLGS